MAIRPHETPETASLARASLPLFCGGGHSCLFLANSPIYVRYHNLGDEVVQPRTPYVELDFHLSKNGDLAKEKPFCL